MNYASWLYDKCKSVFRNEDIQFCIKFGGAITYGGVSIIADLFLFLILCGKYLKPGYIWLYEPFKIICLSNIVCFFVITYHYYRKDKMKMKEEIIDKMIGDDPVKCPSCLSSKSLKIQTGKYPVYVCKSCGVAYQKQK